MRLLGMTALIAMAGLLIAASCQDKPKPAQAQENDSKEGKVVAQSETNTPPFEPQVAGGFYPAAPGKLRGMIQGYLQEAEKVGKKVEGDLLGIIVPHAGYPYSGPVAAFAFQALRGRSYKRVVVLGPAHRQGFSLPALLDASAYRTPLGDIPIDAEGVKKLAATGAARVEERRFRGEHALEVELPFLQVALQGWKMIPIMISDPDPAATKKLAKALWEAFPGSDTLFVASTDLSHDYPYEVASAMDANAAKIIEAVDPDRLHQAYQAYRRAGRNIKATKDGRPDPDCTQLCGMGPVLTLLEVARLAKDAQAVVLDRRNSGDIVGDKKSRIVGYLSAAVTLEKERQKGNKGSSGDYLNHEEKQELLKLARQTLEVYLKDGEKPDFDPKHENLKKPGAAFVTLKNHGRLRGCIGYMEPIDPLWKMIRDRAVDASVNDSRFNAVTKEELKDITIEISVLTPRVPVKDPLKEIEIGRDGVWLEIGRNRGVFLPQVPVEQNWKTVEVYLDNLCRKAHVYERGCWKSEHAKLQRFTALVFSEKE